MTVFLVVLAGACLAIAFVFLLLPQSAARQQSVLLAASREVGLGLTEDVRRPILQRSRRAQRLSFVGGVFGWAAGIWLVPRDGPSMNSLWLILGGILLGGALGNLTAALVDSRTPTFPVEIRMARATVVGVRDFISPTERSFGWVSTAAVIGGSALCVMAGVRDPLLLIALPGLVAALWILGAVGTRFVVSRPQHARTTLDLAWDDALRAKNLLSLLRATPLAAIYGGIAMMSAFDGGARTMGWQVAIAALGLVPPLAVLLMAGRGGGRFYLRHLWPQTAAELDGDGRARG